MKNVLPIVSALATLSTAASAQRQSNGNSVAPQATTDPLRAIYRVSGVYDSGDPGYVGTVTIFHCSNFERIPQNLFFRILDNYGNVVKEFSTSLAGKQTLTFKTRNANIFAHDYVLATGQLIQASATIFASSNNIGCSTMIVDAASFTPNGISLNMVRYNAAPNTME